MIDPSVTGKNWIYKKYDSNDVKNIAEKYSISQIAAKLLSIKIYKQKSLN